MITSSSFQQTMIETRKNSLIQLRNTIYETSCHIISVWSRILTMHSHRIAMILWGLHTLTSSSLTDLRIDRMFIVLHPILIVIITCTLPCFSHNISILKDIRWFLASWSAFSVHSDHPESISYPCRLWLNTIEGNSKQCD